MPPNQDTVPFETAIVDLALLMPPPARKRKHPVTQREEEPALAPPALGRPVLAPYNPASLLSNQCDRCVIKKIGCDGKQPCGSCADGGLPCLWSTAGTTREAIKARYANDKPNGNGRRGRHTGEEGPKTSSLAREPGSGNELKRRHRIGKLNPPKARAADLQPTCPRRDVLGGGVGARTGGPRRGRKRQKTSKAGLTMARNITEQTDWLQTFDRGMDTSDEERGRRHS